MTSWRPRFRRLGGDYHYVIETPEDLLRLGELELTRWLALSAPISAFAAEPRFLEFLDVDGDRRIQAGDLRAAATWLAERLGDASRLGAGEDFLTLCALAKTPAGERLQRAASRILAGAGAPPVRLELARVREYRQILENQPPASDPEILESAREWEKLLLLHRHLFDFANNFVAFPAVYDPARLSLIEAGRLYLGGRLFRLNLRVTDIAAHKPVAERAELCLLYLEVGEGGERFTIVTAVTAGAGEDLWTGRLGLFVTPDGRQLPARIVELIARPVNLREALWAPFKRLGEFVGDKLEFITTGGFESLEKNLAPPPGSPPPAPGAVPGVAPAAVLSGAILTASRQAPARYRDLLLGGSVAFAAVGGGLAYIATALASADLSKVAQICAGFLVFLTALNALTAHLKLRRRNLGALLAAGGWAVNFPLKLDRSLDRLFTEVSGPPATVASAPDTPAGPSK